MGSLKKNMKFKIFQMTDIFVIIESWLKPSMKFILKNFTVIRNDRLSNKGEVYVSVLRKT